MSCRQTNCRWGCTLQTGSLLIAIFYTFTSPALMGICIWIAATFKIDYFMRRLMVIQAGVCGVSAYFAILLWIGVVKEIPSILKVWIMQQYASLIFVSIAVITAMISGDWMTLGGGGLIIVMTVSFILVVDSYHKNLAQENTPFKRLENSDA